MYTNIYVSIQISTYRRLHIYIYIDHYSFCCVSLPCFLCPVSRSPCLVCRSPCRLFLCLCPQALLQGLEAEGRNVLAAQAMAKPRWSAGSHQAPAPHAVAMSWPSSCLSYAHLVVQRPMQPPQGPLHGDCRYAPQEQLPPHGRPISVSPGLGNGTPGEALQQPMICQGQVVTTNRRPEGSLQW